MNNTINLQQLHDLLADASGLSDSIVEKYVKALFDCIADSLEENGIAVVPKIGTFKADTEASDIIFTPDPALAKAVNEPFSFFEAVPLNVEPEKLDAAQAARQQDVEPTAEDITGHNAEAASDTMPQAAETMQDSPAEEDATNPAELIALSAAVPETEDQESEPDTDDEDSDSDEEYTPEYDDENDDDEVVRVSRAWPVVAGVLAGLVTGIIIGFLLCHHLYVKNGPNRQPAISETDTGKKAPEPTDTVAVYLIDNPNAEKPVPDSTESVTAPVVTDTVTTTRFLATMARKYYGATEFWIYIYEENRDKLPANPNKIKPGTAVVIPPIEKYVKTTDRAQARAEASRKIAELDRSLR